MSQQLRSIGPISCARVMAVLYAGIGLLIGALFSLFFFFSSIIGYAAGLPGQRGGALGFLIGVGSILFFPICYGILGAIGGLIVSGLYNVVARYVGGIEIEIG